MEVQFCILTLTSFAGLCFLCQAQAHIVSSVTSARHKRSWCGANLFAQNGMIQSPDYPKSYPPDSRCVWYLNGPERSRIILTFEDLDIENATSCRYDSLDVRDGLQSSSKLLARFCGTVIPSPVESSGNHMTVYFRSDVSTHGKGFKAHFRSVNDCDEQISSGEGNVTSPFYPNKYGKDHDCIWVITVPVKYQVMLRFRSFQLENSPDCEYDFVEIHDGSNIRSPVIGKFCGSDVPKEIRSSWNSITIRLKTDDRREYRGFSAHFVKVQPFQAPAVKLTSTGIRNLGASLITVTALFLLKYVLT